MLVALWQSNDGSIRVADTTTIGMVDLAKCPKDRACLRKIAQLPAAVSGYAEAPDGRIWATGDEHTFVVSRDGAHVTRVADFGTIYDPLVIGDHAALRSGIDAVTEAQEVTELRSPPCDPCVGPKHKAGFQAHALGSMVLSVLDGKLVSYVAGKLAWTSSHDVSYITTKDDVIYALGANTNERFVEELDSKGVVTWRTDLPALQADTKDIAASEHQLFVGLGKHVLMLSRTR